jgi:hypothetical protein
MLYLISCIYDIYTITHTPLCGIGKQQLPEDYYKELVRVPYLTIVVGSLIAYQLHPFMQAGAALTKW